ncbi:hypothetical protein V8D89_006654 [Ganoderma adspersum]
MRWRLLGYYHPQVVHNEVYENDPYRRGDSAISSLDLLRRHRSPGLDDEYMNVYMSQGVGASARVMDDLANLASLYSTTHAKFHTFGLCVSTQASNIHEFKATPTKAAEDNVLPRNRHPSGPQWDEELYTADVPSKLAPPGPDGLSFWKDLAPDTE